jgi:flagellar export protein FliJ
MKPRSQRLARVLRVREVQEQLARRTWLTAEGQARNAEQATDDLRAARASMTSRLGESLTSLSPSWVMLSQAQIDRTGVRARAQAERARTLRGQAEATRAPWQERRAAARGLARLVERARNEEYAEALAAEARAMDEIAAQRGARQGRERSER